MKNYIKNTLNIINTSNDGLINILWQKFCDTFFLTSYKLFKDVHFIQTPIHPMAETLLQIKTAPTCFDFDWHFVFPEM